MLLPRSRQFNLSINDIFLVGFPFSQRQTGPIGNLAAAEEPYTALFPDTIHACVENVVLECPAVSISLIGPIETSLSRASGRYCILAKQGSPCNPPNFRADLQFGAGIPFLDRSMRPSQLTKGRFVE